jgi:pyruvate,water dikinase
MSPAADPNSQERFHEKNYALITHDYLNLSNRLGFHFVAIEAFLGEPGENAVSVTFYGGAAELPQRVRRVRFLTRVLEDLGFWVATQEDSLTARLDADARTLEEKLEVLGRLMMASRQLDRLMISEERVAQYYRVFSQSHPQAG